MGGMGRTEEDGGGQGDGEDGGGRGDGEDGGGQDTGMGPREGPSALPGQHSAHSALRGRFCSLLPEEAGQCVSSALGERLRGGLAGHGPLPLKSAPVLAPRGPEPTFPLLVHAGPGGKPALVFHQDPQRQELLVTLPNTHQLEGAAQASSGGHWGPPETGTVSGTGGCQRVGLGTPDLSSGPGKPCSSSSTPLPYWAVKK